MESQLDERVRIVTLPSGDEVGSVYDMINVALGSKNPHKVWLDLLKVCPNFEFCVLRHKFEGQGQKLTPVIKLTDKCRLLSLLSGGLALRARNPEFQFTARKLPREEWHLQAHIHSILGGRREVRCGTLGRIDILTDEFIVEVKRAHRWMAAIGQLRVYETFFPGRRQILWIFGATSGESEIRRICKQLNVGVIFDHTTSRQRSIVKTASHFKSLISSE